MSDIRADQTTIETEDMAIGGNWVFANPIIVVTPTASNHAASKEYVDTAGLGINVDFFFTDTVSDIGGIYFDAEDNPTGEAESFNASGTLAIGNDQNFTNYATTPGNPGITTLVAGVYNGHFHLEKFSGTRDVTFYWELYSRTTGGSETLLMTSEVSAEVTTKVELDLHASIPSDVSIGATDRIVLKLYANVSGGGSDVVVRSYQEGTNDSRLEIRTSTEILTNIFVKRDGLSGGQTIHGGIIGSETLNLYNNFTDAQGIQIDANGNILLTNDLGITGTRINKGWFADIEITNMPTVGGTSINANAVLDLASAAVTQLATIGSVTIINAQWGYLGASDQGIATSDSPTFVGQTLSGLNTANGIVRTDGSGVLSSSTSLNVDNITLTNIETDNFKVNVVDTDGTLAANSDTRFSSQKAIKTFVNNSLSGLSWRPAVDLLDSTQTDAGTNIVGQASYSADSVALVNGDRLLLTAEATAPGTYLNRVFLVGGVGSAITLTLEVDGQAGDGSPTDGDTLFAQRGTANGDKSYTYDGTDFVLGASLNGALLATNNLSDVSSSTIAATNLGLGTGNSPTFTGLTLSGLANGLVKSSTGVLSGGNSVTLTTEVSGILPVANGGTNISSYAIGDIIYASGATTLSKLADVATGNSLISGGVGVAPSWGKIGLTTHISGILGQANGGSGIDTSGATDGQLLIGGTSSNDLQLAAILGTNNRVTVANGTNTITLSGPQDIHSGASPTFAGLTINLTSGQVDINNATAVTNTAPAAIKLNTTTSATPATGIGVSMEFEVETSVSNNEILGIMECIAEDVTAASEDGKFIFKLMQNGAAAAEVCSITSAGDMAIAGDLDVTGTIQGGSGVDGLFALDDSGATEQVRLSANGTSYVKNGGFVVGDSTVTNSSTGLELDSTTLAFLASRMTTAQKTALTAVNGMIVYDTTLNRFEGYENGSWVDL